MRNPKTLKDKFSNLNDQVSLLLEACNRFFAQHKLNEINNIAHRLRLLICEGRGNNLLFRLAKEKRKEFKVLVLKNNISVSVTEIEPKTKKVIQQIESKRLFVNPIPGSATLPIISLDERFRPWLEEVDFEHWLENGFLLDWQVPNDKGVTPLIESFSPRRLIKSYADTEASHSDEEFAKEFGCSIESWSEGYIFNGKKLMIPVMYNYLYQIGLVTAIIAQDFIKS